ncbi:hypothetical protein OAD26_00005, partial [bacterium]|nr:hypothetical protein [bacterium]
MGIFDKLNLNKLTGKKEDLVADSGAGGLSLTDVIAPSAVNISPRSINVSGKLSRVFFVVSYPRYLNTGWMEPLLNLEREMDVSLVVHPIDTADTLKKFQKKVAEVQSQINQRANDGMVRDPQLDAAYRNLEDLRDKLQQAEEKLFNVGLYIAIYGDTEADLNKTEAEIKGMLDSRLIYIKPALFQQDAGL